MPDQVQSMMIGWAFLTDNHVHINEAIEALEFEGTDHVAPNKKRLARFINRPAMITAATCNSIIKKNRQKNKLIEVYSVTLSDIDKALAPKKTVDPRKFMLG